MLLLLIAIYGLTGCKSFILKTVVKTVDPYFHNKNTEGTKFEQVAKDVYTFQWKWYRNLIIKTDEGFVIIDPMSPQMATELKKELDQRFNNIPVHTLIYSHYHLDHTSGGAILEPQNVLSHKNSQQYWSEIEHPNVLMPTDYITGDTRLIIGGIEIELLYLGLSHTNTLYAFHLPSKRLVYTADLGFVKAVQPVGVPDRYAPGYLKAMDRVIAIDFDTFIPSHFGYGVKQDLIDWRNMMEDGRRLAREAKALKGTPGVRVNQMGKYFDAVYYPMRDKYGKWHGFNEMFVLNLVRDITGESLGY